MYRSEKRIIDWTTVVLSAAAFALIVPLLSRDLFFAGQVVAAGLVFVLVSILALRLRALFDERLRRKRLVEGDAAVLVSFVDRIRFCFTMNDLVRAFRETLEYYGDCTVLMVDMSKHYAVYNSPTVVGDDPAVLSELVHNYEFWKDGLFFFSDNLNLLSDNRDARGFFVVSGNLQTYFFLRLSRFIDTELFSSVYTEFQAFLRRNETIERMFNIASVSKEWSMVAETQRSFLPKGLPDVAGMELASYFHPLLNVSGDYYDVLPIDEDRTLLVLGDVSGKGLAAALVMGVVVNTIRVIERKDDLVGLVRSVDAAIKGMRLQDKYTVLFLGIVDTRRMVIRYINASMADPIIVSETKAGRQIRHLQSNCSLIGILELEDFAEQEVKILHGDMILATSDGVSEASDSEGHMLGESEEWIDFVTEESAKSAEEFVHELSDLVTRYSGENGPRDDVTILAAKVLE